MSSFAATRCQHIKVNGTQCGSPALRNKKFCYYHQQNRPWPVECFADDKYATGTITLPYFEDAHSIQSVIRQTVQMVMQKRIECKTASVLLYALQIASSNLKRMELEKPQPEQVVTDAEIESKPPMSIRTRDEVARDNWPEDNQNDSNHEDLPPGTIQACIAPRNFALLRKPREKRFIPEIVPVQ